MTPINGQLWAIANEVLGRFPTPVEFGEWCRLVEAGVGVAQLRARLARCPEARLNILHASLCKTPLPPNLRGECMERLAKGATIEAVAYYLLGRLPDQRSAA